MHANKNLASKLSVLERRKPKLMLKFLICVDLNELWGSQQKHSQMHSADVITAPFPQANILRRLILSVWPQQLMHHTSPSFILSVSVTAALCRCAFSSSLHISDSSCKALGLFWRPSRSLSCHPTDQTSRRKALRFSAPSVTTAASLL